MVEDTKIRILEAAYEEFALKGKDGARMQEIADRAGINKAMLNYYFTSKDQLYIEVIRRKLTDIIERVRSSLEGVVDAREFFRKFIGVSNRIANEKPQLVSLILHGYLNRESEIRELFQEVGFRGQIRDTVQRFIDRGDLRINDTDQIIMHIISLNFHAYILKPFYREFIPSARSDNFAESRIEAVIDLFEHGLFTDRA